MIPTATVRQLDEENPWPGLESFREDAQAFFFGREREAQVLLHQVLDSPATVLYGRSGLGKTSLLRAGLFPLLRERDYLPVYVRFDLSQNPGSLSRQLHQAVCASILADVPDAMLPAGDESLWEYLHRNDFELWSERNYPLTPVLVLDQFEELFTLGARVPDLVEAFRNEFGDLAENRIPGDLTARIDDDPALADRYDPRSRNYKLLISLREDFLPDLQEWSRLIPTLGRSRVRLRPLSADDAFDAVYKPASHLMTEHLARRVVGIIAGEGLHSGRDGESPDTDRDLDAGGTADVEPPLLSLVCRELNEVRKQRGLSQFDEQLIDEAGHETLSNYYSSCVSGMRPEVARFIETELISENGEYRENFIRDEAVPARLTEGELTQLISSRLVRLEDQYGVRRIELTHDVLTRAVREHRDRRLAEDQQAALAAEEARREAELEHERDRRRESERVARRFRWLSAALALVCVGALVAVGFAVKASQNADREFRDATVQRLYGESQLALNGLQKGGGDDVVGMQELLAASAIPSRYRDEEYPLLSALNQERDLLKVIDVPEVVSSVAFSPGGDRIVSGSTDNSVRVWDAVTGRPVVKPLLGHDGWVMRVAFSPDGKRIASAGLDGTMRLWDAATGQPFSEPIRANGPLYSVVFSPDGRHIATSGLNEVQLWDVSTRLPIGEPMLGHDGIVWDVAFSRDGTRLVSGGSDKTVRLWDAATGRPIGEPLHGHDDYVRQVAFSPDGSHIVSGSTDKTVRLWDAATGSPFGEVLQLRSPVACVALSPDGERIAAGSNDGSITLWDAATGHVVGILPGHRASVESVAFSPDGLRLVSGGDDKTVRLWDVASWQPMTGHTDTVSAEYSADGHRVASGGKDKTVRWWDAATGRSIGPPLRVDDAGIESLYPLGADRLLSIGSDLSEIRVWDAHTLKPIAVPLRLDPPPLGWRSITSDENGDRIAANPELSSVQVWNTRTMQPMGEPITLSSVVFAIGFSRDGRLLAIGTGDGTTQVWDADTGRPIGQPMGHDGYVSAVAFSGDARLLAVGSSSGSENTLQLWDTRTFQPTGVPMRVDSEMTVAAFSPDGRILATGAADGIRLWDVEHRSQFGPLLTGHEGSVTSLDFSPDGKTLLSGSDDHTVRRWPVPSLSPSPDELCAKLTHNMSRAQWNDIVSPKIPYVEACHGLPDSENSG